MLLTVVFVLKLIVSSFKLFNSIFLLKHGINFKGQSGSSGCKITLPTDIPENEPVYLIEEDGKLELYRPAGRENYFKVNQELQLFCPGKNNKLTNNAGKMANTALTTFIFIIKKVLPDLFLSQKIVI